MSEHSDQVLQRRRSVGSESESDENPQPLEQEHNHADTHHTTDGSSNADMMEIVSNQQFQQLQRQNALPEAFRKFWSIYFFPQSILLAAALAVGVAIIGLAARSSLLFDGSCKGGTQVSPGCVEATKLLLSALAASGNDRQTQLASAQSVGGCDLGIDDTDLAATARKWHDRIAAALASTSMCNFDPENQAWWIEQAEQYVHFIGIMNSSTFTTEQQLSGVWLQALQLCDLAGQSEQQLGNATVAKVESACEGLFVAIADSRQDGEQVLSRGAPLDVWRPLQKLIQKASRPQRTAGDDSKAATVSQHTEQQQYDAINVGLRSLRRSICGLDDKIVGGALRGILEADGVQSLLLADEAEAVRKSEAAQEVLGLLVGNRAPCNAFRWSLPVGAARSVAVGGRMPSVSITVGKGLG